MHKSDGLMRPVNDFLATTPFDIYELALFRLVVEHGSFTKAAEIAGLTQSAITRQVQGMENSLGLELLERTTRRVRVTPAGEFLFAQSAQLLGDVDRTLRRLREEYAGARKEIRVGVARTVGLSYLPGFFHSNLRKLPAVGYRVSNQDSTEILAGIEANTLDLGILCPPNRLPETVSVTHRFEDAFTLLVPRQETATYQAITQSTKALKDWLKKQNWLLIKEGSNTGQRLREWTHQQGLRIEPTMQLDSFDLIINLVALGMGISFVPIRALALYGRKRTLQRIPMPERFVRELMVVVRRHGKTPEHLTQFVANVLF
jgi:DNA-binding transcriptional LysR family regulator